MKAAFNILLIDDEEPMLDALKLNLEQVGYSVSTATTGARGLALFDSRDFDLVVADLQLPDVEGLDVLRKIKEKKPTIEVIIISAYGSVNKAVEATKPARSISWKNPLTLTRSSCSSTGPWSGRD